MAGTREIIRHLGQSVGGAIRAKRKKREELESEYARLRGNREKALATSGEYRRDVLEGREEIKRNWKKGGTLRR